MQVWQKLEEQNPDFFKAYVTRLKLKDQINLFNHLLEQQIQVSSSLCNSCSLAVKIAGMTRNMAPNRNMALPAPHKRTLLAPVELHGSHRD